MGSAKWLKHTARKFKYRPRDTVNLRIASRAEARGLETGQEVRARTMTALTDSGKLLVFLEPGCAAVVDPGRSSVDRADKPVEGMLVLPPADFEPVPWADLAAADARWKADGTDYKRLGAFRRAFLDHLPPPAGGRLSRMEQAALVFAFWIGLFLAALARARPALCLLGPKGSGKTVTGRLLGMLFAGSRFDVSGSVGGSRNVKDLVATLIGRALVVRDDLNDASGDILDVLCRSVTGAEVALSALYETLELATFRGDASLAITAIRPSWACRDDVLSRFLVLALDSPPASDVSDREREARVASLRAEVWLETLLVLRDALASPSRRTSVTRFGDWERVVTAAAAVVGLDGPLRSALEKMDLERVLLAVDADPLLALLWSFAKWPGVADQWWSAAGLCDAISESTGTQSNENEPHRTAPVLRSPMRLAKFLSKLQREGSAVVQIDKRPGPNGRGLLWRVRPLA